MSDQDDPLVEVPGKGYKLLDAVEQNKRYPETFKIPDKERIDALKAGEHVKLWFTVPGRGTERMWVIIMKVLTGGRFEGMLDNDPINFPRRVLTYGNMVKFEARNILSTFD